MPTPALLAEAGAGAASDNVCLPCHTPDAGDERPRASAAALWLGRGGLDPATGAALAGAAPHAGIPGACVGCHRAGPDDVERGAGHGFRAPASVCAPCHPQPIPSQDVRARAQQLWRALRKTDAGGPVHAAERDGLRVDKRTPLGRATWDLLLVLEDPAAGAHNARYAQALLDAAASVIEAGSTRRAR